MQRKSDRRRVLVISSKFCPPCEMLKDFLIKHNIPFEEIVVEENKHLFKNRKTPLLVPMVYIGDEKWIGFSENLKKRLLEVFG